MLTRHGSFANYKCFSKQVEKNRLGSKTINFTSDTTHGVTVEFNSVISSPNNNHYIEIDNFSISNDTTVWENTNICCNDKDYRYGFNTQEKDNEVAGEGNSYTAVPIAIGRQYDGRLGRRWNLDPRPNPSSSCFSVFGNSPLINIDINGDTVKNYASLELIPKRIEFNNLTREMNKLMDELYGKIGLTFMGSKKDYIRSFKKIGENRKTAVKKYKEYQEIVKKFNNLSYEIKKLVEKEELINRIIETWRLRSADVFKETNSQSCNVYIDVDKIENIEGHNNTIAYYEPTFWGDRPRDANRIRAVQVKTVADNILDNIDNWYAPDGEVIIDHEAGHFIHFVNNVRYFINLLLSTPDNQWYGGHGNGNKNGEAAQNYGKRHGRNN